MLAVHDELQVYIYLRLLTDPDQEALDLATQGREALHSFLQMIGFIEHLWFETNAEEAEEHIGTEAGDSEDADGGRRVGEFEDEPGQGGVLHLGPGDG